MHINAMEGSAAYRDGSAARLYNDNCVKEQQIGSGKWQWQMKPGNRRRTHYTPHVAD